MFTNKNRYCRLKKTLLSDKTICGENRKLFKDFFEYEEYKLKRINNLRELDESAYKTLVEYCSRFRTVNKWFENKPWKDLTKEDIKRVYDDIEDGRILTNRGTPYKNRRTYYNKIFKSKPFELAGKAQAAREILGQFVSRREKREVRFVTHEDFLKLVEVAIQPIHKLLMWLAWDIGENMNSLLQLRKKDFYRQVDPSTHEPEYLVHLRKEILKRARQPRSEPTNFQETVTLADLVLKDLSDEDTVFHFGYKQAQKIFVRAVELTGVKCMPENQKPSWKDLRSGMACYLLKKGWSREDINARLGHVPSSSELDAYINFLAVDRRRPKRKLHESNIQRLQDDVEGLRTIVKELKRWQPVMQRVMAHPLFQETVNQAVYDIKSSEAESKQQ